MAIHHLHLIRHRSAAGRRLRQVGLLLLILTLLWLTGRAVRAEKGITVTLPEVVDLPAYGLALENEILALGNHCSDLVRDLRLIGAPVDDFLGSGRTFARYQITGGLSIADRLPQSQDGCQLFPNYLLFMSGTNSVFGSPFDNPNSHAPDPARIQEVRTILRRAPASPFQGAGITVAVFDTYCPATSHAPASDHFLQAMGVANLTLQPSFIRSLQATGAHPLGNQCSHNEAIISLLKTVAPAAAVELWPVLDEQGFGALSGLLQAFHAFAQTKSDTQPYVINLSLGIAGRIDGLASVLQQLAGPGHLLVAAAGNWRDLPNPLAPPNSAQAPAALQQFVLAVHATDALGDRTRYSNLGAIGAPGGLHTCTTNSIGQPTAACLTFFNSRAATSASGWKGSSYATALTSGVVALLLEQEGGRDLTEVRRLLWCGAHGSDGLIDVDYTLFHCRTHADLGDAPDGINASGVSMSTYPSSIQAAFPTIYGEASAPLGPIHWRPNANSWLGRTVSGEKEADQLPDSDGVSNLDLYANLADRDGGDDGLSLSTLSLPECARTRFQYGVTVAAKGTARYVNIWFDYNRDGDWDDSVLCTEGRKRYRVSEWAVRNQVVPATLGVGYRLRTTPDFRAGNTPTPTNPLWLRITLSEQKAPLIPGQTVADGRGPTQGYRFGETEDYLISGTLPLPAMDSSALVDDASVAAAEDGEEVGDFDGFNDKRLDTVADASAPVYKFYLPLLAK